MDSLKVPDKGLLLEGSSSSETPLPPQAFAITLGRGIIEGLISSVQNGDDIQLALGQSPTLQYGTKSHRLTAPPDSLPYDLFLTKPFESTRTAARIPSVGSLFQPPEKQSSSGKTGGRDTDLKHKQTGSSKASGSSEIDSDIETLQKGLAAHEAAIEKTHMVSNLPSTKKGAAKARDKIMAASSTNGSPSVRPLDSSLSASQQVMERARQLRAPLVHELAVRDRSFDYLEDIWKGKPEEFKAVLGKVADLLPNKTYVLTKPYWKELDVFEYDYATDDERQKAIQNAIKQYDKQRLSSYEPEWQRLLPKEDRGKGICLSKLQNRIAMGPSYGAPKIKLSNVDDGSTPKDDLEGLSSDKSKNGGDSMARSNSNKNGGESMVRSNSSKSGGESMVRTNSNTRPAKARKLPSSNPLPKPSGTITKAKLTKPSPSKPKATSKANDGRILSKEIIVNSDSSGDEGPPPAKSKPTPKLPASKTADTVVVKTKAANKPVAKPVPSKSRRDEEDSSSSSGTPLARRLTQKTAKPIPPTQKQKVTGMLRENKPQAPSGPKKNTTVSPAKSSPLASSPPTNASEIDDEETPPPPPRKRKAEQEIRAAPAKRQARTVSSDVVKMATQFKQAYKQYEKLHYEVSALEYPPRDKVNRLLDLRERLGQWKRDIYNQSLSDRDSG